MLWCIILLLVSVEGEEGIHNEDKFDEEWWEAYMESLYLDTLPIDSTIDTSKVIDAQDKEDDNRNIRRGFFKSGIQIAALFIFLIVILVYIKRRFRF